MAKKEVKRKELSLKGVKMRNVTGKAGERGAEESTYLSKLNRVPSEEVEAWAT